MKTYKGTLHSVPMGKGEIPELTNSPNFALVYYPSALSHQKVFWAKRMGRIYLFTMFEKRAFDYDSVEIGELRKIVFRDKEGNQHPLTWSQWDTALATDKVDTKDEVSGVLKDGRIKIVSVSDEPVSESEVWKRICTGFNSPKEAREALELFGYTLAPKELIRETA